MMFFSRTTGGFYSSDFHDVIPNDCVEVSDADYSALFNAVRTGKDKVIVSDANGYPIVTDSPIILSPNLGGFIADIKAGLGGIVALNGLMRLYPAFSDALNAHEWDDILALVVDARVTGVLSDAQYAAFQSAFAANHIPVVLP